MLIMLFHFKRLPFQMLRLAPNPEKPGDIIMEIYEGDIRKWIASIADSENAMSRPRHSSSRASKPETPYSTS